MKKSTEKNKKKAVLVRIPGELLLDLDSLIVQYKSEHPLATWSRNNVILAAIKSMIEYAKK